MTKYVKKPIEVEAVQWFKMGDHPKVTENISINLPPGVDLFCIKTLEGLMNVKPGDWIITGIKGEHYACKDDIFRATYEEVSEQTVYEPFGYIRGSYGGGGSGSSKETP